MKIFIDTSVLVAVSLSPEGGSAHIIKFCEAKILHGVISTDVEKELREVVERKFPEAIGLYKTLLKAARLQVLSPIRPALLKKALHWMNHPNDAKMLAAAIQAKVDYLVTLDVRHFLKDPGLAQQSGMKISTPGELLKIIRMGIK